MKQAILTFDKCQILVVELPEGAYGVGQQHIYHGEDPITYHIEGHGDRNYGFKFPGFVELMGKLSELTEDQAIDFVDKVMSGQHYQNYSFKSGVDRWVKTAKESFLSKLRADGYYTENPAGPIDECVISAPGSGPYEYEMAMWNMGEEKTFQPSLTWVFTIKQ